MNRHSFLSEKWQAFPPIPQDVSSLTFGRIKRLDGPSAVLVRDRSEINIAEITASPVTHPYLGPSIPVEFLQVGDVVAYCHKERAFYLLSPCQQPSDQLFDWQAQQWSQFIEKVRQFFLEQDFTQILTPYLVTSPGVDHHIDFLQVHAPQSKKSWCLPTSPEISLKKYLCRGYDKIFEIKHCFRDDLKGPHHNQEFLMVEWYRCYEPLAAIQKDLRQLISSLMGEELHICQLTVAEAFRKYLDYDLQATTTQGELLKLCEVHQVQAHSSDDWNDLFFRLFMDKVEPFLGFEGPVLLSQFPAQQASLSQVNEKGWCERFELYWQGVELANAYLEVNDPQLNEERFRLEVEKRRHKACPVSDWDQAFFAELQSGMPPASGVALGLDRLFMVLMGKKTIDFKQWY